MPILLGHPNLNSKTDIRDCFNEERKNNNKGMKEVRK